MSLLRYAVKERELQQQVIELARLSGWLVFHDQDSRRNAPGLPDLILVPPVPACGRVLWVELKTEKGRLRKEQKEWRDRLLGAGADWRLWRPSDWPEIEDTLRRNN